MPPYLTNPDNRLGPQDYPNVSHDYKYPRDLNLKPGSKTHAKIVSEVMLRARESRAMIQTREAEWNQADKTLTSYVRMSDEERRVRSRDSKKPISVVIPLSYATMETILTYYTQRFVTDPFFGFSGTGPEDQLGAAVLERVIQLQVIRNKIALSMHTMWRDSLAYGFGAVTPRWEQKWGLRSVTKEEGFFGFMGKFFSTSTKKVLSREVLYEGNVVDNIDPYNYLPDPSVPVTEAQKGEYVGWVVRSNYYSLLSAERTSDGAIFNVKYLERQAGASSLYTDISTGRDKNNFTRTTHSQSSRVADTIYMTINLIPQEWGLGPSEYPEKWLFGVTGDRFVTVAEPQELEHDMFPIAVFAPESDGHSVFPTSKLEVVKGLQETVDWMVSTHITNIRKALNDMWLVDPMMVNMADLQSPEPGKLIRTRRSAWGRGVENAVKQFPVSDVTRQHISEIPFLADIFNRVTGSVDTMMGVMRTGGERRSALEARDTKAAATSRLEKGALIGSMQAHWDLQHMLASQTQQFMSQDMTIKATGRLAELIAREQGIDPQTASVSVNADQLRVSWDLLPADGAQSGGEFAQTWVQLLQIAGSSPELSQKVDLLRVYLHAARIAGAKNIQDFVRMGGQIQTQVLPDSEVSAQASAGNVVPLQEYADGL